MLPQSAAVAFVLAEVAVNGAVMECDPVVFMQVGTYLFGTEFAADKGVDVLNQLRIELIGFSPVLFGQPVLPLGFIGAVLLSLDAVPLDFSADGAFVAVELFGDFGDGAVAGQVLDMVSFVLGQLCVAHGNLSCRKGRMLPHTGLFLLWKVALQMRIRRRLKTLNCTPKVGHPLQLTRCSFFMSKYTLHFKYQAVLHYLHIRSQQRTADHYGISRTHLRRWIRAYQEGGIGALEHPQSKTMPQHRKNPFIADKPDQEKTQAELIEELCYMRAEVAYLKELKALSQKQTEKDKAKPSKH